LQWALYGRGLKKCGLAQHNFYLWTEMNSSKIVTFFKSINPKKCNNVSGPFLSWLFDNLFSWQHTFNKQIVIKFRKHNKNKTHHEGFGFYCVKCVRNPTHVFQFQKKSVKKIYWNCSRVASPWVQTIWNYVTVAVYWKGIGTFLLICIFFKNLSTQYSTYITALDFNKQKMPKNDLHIFFKLCLQFFIFKQVNQYVQ
jgi:hypothetical protein